MSMMGPDPQVIRVAYFPKRPKLAVVSLNVVEGLLEYR
jgi:hypothetical protein